MSFKNLLITAFRALRKNKIRSALTSVGIIIGVSSVIVMIGIGNSARVEVKAKINTFGANALSVDTLGKPFSDQDVKLLRETIYQIRYITPNLRLDKAIARYGKEKVKIDVFGVNTDYFPMREKQLYEGRFFTENEVLSIAKVAVIGKTVHNKLFGASSAIGETIMIYNCPLMVIGILDETGESIGGGDFDDIIVLPYTTAQKRLFWNNAITTMDVSAINEESVDNVKQGLMTFMRRKNQIIEGREDTFRIRTSKEKLKAAEDISRALAVLLAGIASISLFVGGVGIMNIMLVSVTERTREIGIRMAIGAKKKDIMLQFLIESVALSVSGGIVGIILGLGIYAIIAYFVHWPVIISLWSVLISVLFAAAVGVFFGFYPSRRAADLKPIDALKYE